MGSAPIRIAAFLLALMLHTQCSPTDIEGIAARPARRAAERYLAALVAHDAEAIRDAATCVLSTGAVRGAIILREEPLRSLSRAALDSLAAAAGADERTAGEAWSRATEADADSLWLRRRALERRGALYRNALAAAARSEPTAAATRRAVAGDTPRAIAPPLRTCRMRVRVRWGGPLVGPVPVDREHVLRALAAPGGRWIVFSMLPREDDPPN